MWKNLLLAGASLVVFAALIEGALALMGVETALERRDPFVGFAAQVPLYRETEGGTPGVLETARARRGHFNLQRFEREKPGGTYRIVCLGGSTTYGRPYDDRSSFCGWLRALLPLVDPSRTWQVVNAGGISYASYRIANLMDELAGYDPDLFLVYTGHNEFLERRTYPGLLEAHPWVVELRVWLYRTRSYGLLSDAVSAIRSRGDAAPARDVLPGDVEAILDQSAGLSYYERETLQPDAARVHFRLNLERIVERARSAGAAVILVRPASNLRELSPFKSEIAADLPPGAGPRLRDLTRTARTSLAAGQPERALGLLDDAVAIDGRFADAHFLRGRALYALGRDAEARRAFERARDEDVVPLRATSGFADVVTQVAADTGVPLVDFEALAASRAERGVPGADLFYDHVHPTIELNGWLAAAIAEAMVDAGQARPDAASPEAALPTARRVVEASVNRRSHGLAQKNLAKVLSWAGKNEEAYRAALRGVELVGKWHWEAHTVAARTAAKLGDVDAAIGHSTASLRLSADNAEEHSRLGQLLARRGEPERALPHLERAVELRPDFPEASWALGNTLTSMGRHDAALRHYAVAARRMPNRTHTTSFGVALLRAGRTGAARAPLERAIQLDPENAEAAVALAELHAKEGREAEARRWAERGLFLAQKRGDAELARRARGRLETPPGRRRRAER